MKKIVSILLTLMLCVSFALTGCKLTDVPANNELTTEEVVLNTVDGLRRNGNYKTLNANSKVNITEEGESGGPTPVKKVTTSKGEAIIKVSFENGFAADVSNYGESVFISSGKLVYETKTLSYSFARNTEMYSVFQTERYAADTDYSSTVSKEEYDKLTYESLLVKAKQNGIMDYSKDSLADSIQVLFAGYNDWDNGAFSIAKCLKATREGSKKLEDNIAKWLTKLWEAESEKTATGYTVKIDVEKALENTFQLVDNVFEFAVKNKNQTVKYFFENKLSPVKNVVDLILDGVSGVDAEKILEGLIRPYTGHVSVEIPFHATENQSAREYLLNLLYSLTYNGFELGTMKIDDLIRQDYTLNKLFYSEVNGTKKMDLAGWKSSRAEIKKSLFKKANLEININDKFIIDTLKFNSDNDTTDLWGGAFLGHFKNNYELTIAFNGEVVFEDITKLSKKVSTEEVVLNAIDNFRKEGVYKTAHLTLNIDKKAYDKGESDDKYKDCSVQDGQTSLDLKMTFGKNFMLDSVIYSGIENPEYDHDTGEVTGSYFSKKIGIGYLRHGTIFSFGDYVSSSDLDKEKFDAVTRESLAVSAKKNDVTIGAYSGNTEQIIETIYSVLFGDPNDSKANSGLFKVSEVLKATRQTSSKVEDNLAKLLVSYLEVTSQRNAECYIVKLDGKTALENVVFLVDDTVTFVMENKTRKAEYLFTLYDSPIQCIAKEILSGVSAEDAKKLVENIVGVWFANFTFSTEPQGNETGYDYLVRAVCAMELNGTKVSDMTIEQFICEFGIIKEWFVSYEDGNEKFDGNGQNYRIFKEVTEDAIRGEAYLEFYLDDNYIIEKIKGKCEWGTYFKGNYEGEIVFNEKLTFEDLGDYVIDKKATPQNEILYSEGMDCETWKRIYTTEDNNPQLTGGRIETTVADGAVTVALILDDNTKFFEKTFSEIYLNDSVNEEIVFSVDAKTVVCNEKGVAIGTGDKIGLWIGVTEDDGQYYLNITLQDSEYNQFYEVYVKADTVSVTYAEKYGND